MTGIIQMKKTEQLSSHGVTDNYISREVYFTLPISFYFTYF
jgi:hypothetical protein